eukprot:265467-Amphidinium_carterae.1
MRRPAAIPRSYGFNFVLGADCIYVEHPHLGRTCWLNMVCWGTRLQNVEYLGSSPIATTVLAGLMNWCRHYGYPEYLVLGQGPEFEAEVKTWAHFYGIMVHRIDARAPHQQGRTERLGGALKEQVRLASELEDTLELSHFQQLVHACCISRNRFIDRSGYSAEQWVFGTARRWPSELTQDDAIAEDVMAADGNELKGII